MTPARTLFIVASKSGGTVEVASMETVLLGAHASGDRDVAPAGTSSPSPIPGRRCRQLAESRGYRRGLRESRRTSAADSRRCRSSGWCRPRSSAHRSTRSSNGGAAMAEGCRQEQPRQCRARARRVHRRRGARGPRQADGRAPAVARLARPVDRAARSPRAPASTARDRCRSSTNRSAARTSTATIAPSSRSRSESEQSIEQALAALEAAGHPVLRLSTRHRRPRRRVFPLGVRDRGRRRRTRHQSRSTSRTCPKRRRKPRRCWPRYAASRPLRRHARGSNARRPASCRSDASHRLQAARLRRLAVVPAGRSATSRRPSARSAPALRGSTKVASTFGVGPRYLHSTGQYHKGGPNTCVAFVLTADDDTQTEIPEAGYSFSVLKRAQALGDSRRSRRTSRRVVRLHLSSSADAARSCRGFLERRCDEALDVRGSRLMTWRSADPAGHRNPGGVAIRRGCEASRRSQFVEHAARRALRRPCAGCCRARPS